MSNPPIYFVSDTHLGDGTGADRFRYPRQLLSLLRRIEGEPGAQLVLLGDFMELWATSLEGVLTHHIPILQAILRLAETHPVTYVVGNHDCIPWYHFLNQGIGNVRVTERFSTARETLVALHGHQYDPFNRVLLTDEGHVKVPWTEKLVQVIGVLGRVGGSATSDAIANAGELLSNAASSLAELLPDWDEMDRQTLCATLERVKDVVARESPGERGYPLGERIYEEAARNLLRGGARFVVMGHTHHPLRHAYGSRMYANTGSWVSDQYPPTYVRFTEGRLDLHEAETHAPYAPPEGK